MDQLKHKLPDYIYFKLIKANFDSIKSIILTDKIELEEQTKLDSKDVNLVLELTSEIHIGHRIKTAFETPDWVKIRTGCPRIDELLNGGIPVNGINEIYGESGVGKTQFCLQLALMVQLPRALGGLQKSVVYICTEDPFPSKRLEELQLLFLERFDTPNKINIVFSDNIFIEHIPDFEELRKCLCVKLKKLIENVNIGLIIIDSIAGVFRSYNEDRNYQSRSEDFLMISKTLNELCSVTDIGIVCTNQISDNLETGETNPCLGFAWSNLVTSRFCITRSFNRSIRKFHVIFAPHLPPTNCNFFIKENGIVCVD